MMKFAQKKNKKVHTLTESPYIYIYDISVPLVSELKYHVDLNKQYRAALHVKVIYKSSGAGGEVFLN